MEIYSQEPKDELIEAIEGGKIVKVAEEYAKKEGLPILRRPKSVEMRDKIARMPQERTRKMEMEMRKPAVDYLGRKPGWQEKQILDELIENFHWKIRAARRLKGISKTQLSRLINESEESIKMLEFGMLPSPDFVLINKVQAALGINLRKDGRDFTKTIGEIRPKQQSPINAQKSSSMHKKDYHEVLDKKKTKNLPSVIVKDVVDSPFTP